MSKHHVVFCGTPLFACPSLQALYDDPSFAVLSVVTQPDKLAGRGKKLTPPPMKEVALKLGIPVEQPEDINRNQELRIRKQEIDFLVVVAYGQILSSELLRLPKIAPVNVHPSLLPRWRGASPIQNALLAGDRETGVTVQRMVEEIDRGPILAQKRVLIGSRETGFSLEEKLASLGAQLLIRTLQRIKNASTPLSTGQELGIEGTPQEERNASYCKKLTREMGNVDPTTMTAEEIDRRVRALVPWPGVRIRTDALCSSVSRRIHSAANASTKLIETSLVPDPDAIEVPCAQGTTLYVTKLQPPTKRVMTGAEWGRGHL